jgi:non-ribosomal peptide synthetase-like protein
VLTTTIVGQSIVCGVSLLPVVLIWSRLLDLTEPSVALRIAVLSVALVPSYVLFALILMFVSALTTRTLGWRTPPDLETRIADVEWPLLHWVRSMVATHVVRFFAGGLFRGSPVWAMYIRLAGARLGRRVYINSLAVIDYNLLEFGDDVVIGDGVHLSGHTVEHGVLKTGRVRLGRSVTVGVGSIIEIDVEIGDDCQVGALTFVPKHSTLASGGVYAGIPARRIVSSGSSPRATGENRCATPV